MLQLNSFFHPDLHTVNPACGEGFFTVWHTFAKIIKFSDLNRSVVASALGRARAMELSMARRRDGKRSYDAPIVV